MRGVNCQNITEKIRCWYEAWNTRDWELAASLVSEKLVVEDMALGREIHGKVDYLKYAKAWAEAFPDAKIQIDRIIGSGKPGEAMVVEYSASGTQFGHWGVFAPTNRATTMRFCDVLRFEFDKLVSCRTYTDLYQPLAELGHIQSKGLIRTKSKRKAA